MELLTNVCNIDLDEFGSKGCTFLACLTQNLCLEHEKVWPASIMSMFLQQWFCSCRAWMICYKHLRIVSRLTTPKTLNCFILASTIGFGFHRTCKSRKNHFPKLHFWGSYINISKVAVPRLDRAMSDPCLNWDHVTQQSNKPGSIFTAQGGGFRVVSPAAMRQELHEKIRTDGWRWLSSKWKLCQVVWDVKMEICSVNLCLFFQQIIDLWNIISDVSCCWVMACGARS